MFAELTYHSHLSSDWFNLRTQLYLLNGICKFCFSEFAGSVMFYIQDLFYFLALFTSRTDIQKGN